MEMLVVSTWAWLWWEGLERCGRWLDRGALIVKSRNAYHHSIRSVAAIPRKVGQDLPGAVDCMLPGEGQMLVEMLGPK